MPVVDVSKDSVASWEVGHKSVGTSHVQLFPTISVSNVYKGVMIRTPGSSDPAANSAPIWIGKDNVTADSTPGTGGFPLIPGATIVIPLEIVDQIYAISTAASQDLAYMLI